MASAVITAARRPGPLAVIATVYLGAVSGIMIWRGISVSPDYLILLMVPVALLAGRLGRYVRDWVPFIALFLGWEAMRGVAPKLGVAVHVADLAHAETALFGGHLPTAVLQSWTAGAAQHPLALLFTVVYFCHFIFPITVGLVLWLVDRTQFLRYTTALMGMAFVAFVLFLLAPTAPPWYAQDQGVIHGFQKLITSTLPSAVSPYYTSLNPNKVAAFPSLHAAFPLLGFLALRPVFARASWLALGWCVLAWVGAVYLGEHYAVDIAGGIILAAASWLVLMRWVVPHVALLRMAPDPLPEGDVAGEVAAAGPAPPEDGRDRAVA